MKSKRHQLIANALIHLPNNRLINRIVRPIIKYYHYHNLQSITTRMGYSINIGGGDTSLLGIRSLVILGVYEADYMRLLASLVKPGETVVDLGANEGYLSLFLAMKVGPKGHVYAIEPNMNNVLALEANIKLNALTNITIIPKAVSDKAGHFQMYGDRAWGSLYRQSNITNSTYLVKVDTLDALYKDHMDNSRIALIKMDVEGSEIRVLRGAQKLISTLRPIVAFEVNLTLIAYEDISINEIFDFFLESKYSLFIERKGKLVTFEWLCDRVLNLVAIPNERI